MNIHPTSKISLKAHLDKTNPKGIFIGSNTVITPGVHILTHNYIKGDKTYVDTKIGSNVFIGINSVIMPGVSINDNVIIGAGSIITKNINENNCIVAGNPAKIIKSNVKIGINGQLIK